MFLSDPPKDIPHLPQLGNTESELFINGIGDQWEESNNWFPYRVPSMTGLIDQPIEYDGIFVSHDIPRQKRV